MSACDNFSWWQKGVIYEAYIRSFQDSNSDGIGDLAGLIQRLPYLKWLGVDILWIPPFYTSPQLEFGYDIADYTGVDPLFGSLEQVDELLNQAHEMGMKIVLDIAPNHTSFEHPWFLESRSSRDNPKRDWYIWRDPAPQGGPPNNWVSAFGGKSAWEFDPGTGQYYYHAFLKEQPDLNWRNKEVEHAVFQAYRFWLDRGVDGFRIDVMWHLMKDDKFRDNPPNPQYDPKKDPSNNVLRELYSADRPDVLEVIQRMRAVLQEYAGDRLMIGELYQSGDRLVDYYGPECRGTQMPHNQQLILLPWEAPTIRDAIERYEASLPEECWPNWVLGNHDKPRVASRIGHAQARVAMMMLLTLRGTPTIYYGDEIGMENVDIPKDQLRDPFEQHDPGKGQGRDPQRTPMQWDGTQPNAGFSTGKPWLPVSPKCRDINVEELKRDPNSMLTLVRTLLQLRKDEPALAVGEHRLIITEAKGPVIAYRREYENNRFVVALNLSDDLATFELPYGCERTHVVLTTLPEHLSDAFENYVSLRANEGLLLRIV